MADGRSWIVPRPHQMFEARAFPADLSAEPVEGQFRFSPLALTFETGGTVISIPLQHLVTELDEAGEWRIILRDSHHPDWTVITSDLDVLEVRDIPQLAA